MCASRGGRDCHPEPVEGWPRAGAGTLVILVLLVLLPVCFIFRSPLFERDESIHAEVARQILVTGDHVTLHYDGRPWYDKPPLVFWMSAASMRAFGPSEGAARLPVAVCAGLLTLVVWALARDMYGGNAGLGAAAIAAASPMLALTGQMVLMDVPLTLFFTTVMACFWRACQRRGGALFWSAGAGLALGLAVLTKGPVGMALPGMVVLLAMAFRRDLRPPWWTLCIAIGVALAVSIPWHVLVYRANGQAFMDSYLGFHNVRRFLKSEHVHGASPLLYLGVLIVGFLPWTALVAQGVAEAIRRRLASDWLLGLWAVVVLVFFTAASTRLAAYILPAFPPLAILAGRYAARAQQTGRGARLVTGVNAIVVALLGVALVVASRKLPGAEPAAVVWAISASAVAASLAVGRRALAILAVGAVVLLAVLTGLLLPAVSPAASLRGLVRAANRTGGVLCVRDEDMPGSVLFYRRGPSKVVSNSAIPRNALLLARKKDAAGVSPSVVITREGRWVLLRRP